jgi:recombinational DNA repair protein (RecF pathway)
LDFFSELECVYFPNTRSDIWNLADVSTLAVYSTLKLSPQKQALGHIMAEVMLRYGHGSADPEGFYHWLELAWKHLDQISESDASWNFFGPSMLAQFLLGICRMGGFGPRFGECRECGEKIPSAGPLRFQWADGAPLCASCGGQDREGEGEGGGTIRLRAGWAMALRRWTSAGKQGVFITSLSAPVIQVPLAQNPSVQYQAVPFQSIPSSLPVSPNTAMTEALDSRDMQSVLTFLLQYLGRHSGGERPMRAWSVWCEIKAMEFGGASEGFRKDESFGRQS